MANIWDFKNAYQKRPLRVSKSILSTLFACLPNESKELLNKNKIFISTPTSKSPLFKYAEFYKVFSINKIVIIVNTELENETSNNIISLSLEDRKYLVANEIIKMFTNQISSLKKLTCNYYQSCKDFSMCTHATDVQLVRFYVTCGTKYSA
ncbi:hypothetical protein GLOIN_2v1669850 [Rhizophagus clarus]|uniref:Uncharacterized protein n=1 Tax=Rhizophagus clarus TaxID=94130 RepID=A0A8H3QTR9_9GLOM|nr:hypothetical protein GLOIN_2v1669850 [Rhizophagus clarus]